MDSHPPMELDRRFAPSQPDDRVSTPSTDRIIELSSWMMVLGTVRVVCMLADYLSAFADAVRVEPFGMRTFSRLAGEIHPVVAISSAWPLFLAIALRRTRWLQLVPAAAATFLVLSIGGLLELWVQWGRARGYGGMVGSFHLTRRAFQNPNASDFVLGGLGAIQLGLELVTAIRAILLIPRLRQAPGDPGTKAERARQSRCGRMAVYMSLGYLFVVIRLPVWSTYLEVLNNSTFVRNLVLKNDNARLSGRRFGLANVREPTAEEKRFTALRSMITASGDDAQFGRFAEARDRYREVIESIDALPEDALPANRRPELVAMALNNLAWLESTCSDVSFWSPREAVRHARRATVVQPQEGNYWNTLGAALYRAGEWEEAKAAFAQSMTLRRNGNSFDWFFLALAERKLGRAAEARGLYDRAVEWFRQFAPHDQELYRFQVEAAHELGLPKPEAPAMAKGPIPNRLQLSPIRRAVRRSRGDPAPKAKGAEPANPDGQQRPTSTPEPGPS
jgi:tetratricopeptide (TPR) repeat protein